MRAFVNIKGRAPYYTVALAIRSKGWKSKIAYYDPQDGDIKITRFWQKANNDPYRAFYLFDSPKDLYSERGWAGYEYIVKEICAFKPFRKRKFSLAALAMVKRAYQALEEKEWYPLDAEKDVESMLSVALGFHDARLENLSKTNEGYLLDFDTTWGCHILLTISGVQNEGKTFSNSVFCENLETMVYDGCEVTFQEGFLRFCFTELYSLSDCECVEAPSFVCESAAWKFVLSAKQ